MMSRDLFRHIFPKLLEPFNNSSYQLSISFGKLGKELRICKDITGEAGKNFSFCLYFITFSCLYEHV